MAFYDNDAYTQAGAEIVENPADLYGRSDVILKVKEPRMNESIGKHEIELMQEGAILIGFLHPASPANHEMVQMLVRKNITSFTLDGIPRISRAQHMDALTSMSTVAGYKAVIIGAKHLSRFMPMMPTASGVIPPAQVFVLGTGVAGLQSVAMAKRMGSKVKTLDIRPEANEQARSLGAEVIPFVLPEGLGVGEGGYARRLPEEWYEKERKALSETIVGSDMVILAALLPGERAPILVTEAMVLQMKKGSVIVDISVDQGGNCAITKAGEEYSYQGIMISGLANIPATLATDSTRMFAQNAWHFMSHIVKDGTVERYSDDIIIQETLVTRDREIVHRGTLQSQDEES